MAERLCVTLSTRGGSVIDAVTEWHLRHLPVRFQGDDHPRTVVEHVLVSWTERKVEGFLLRSGPFRRLFIPALAGVQVTVTGLELRDRGAVERRSRRWCRQQIEQSHRWKGQAVFSSDNRFVGRVKDLVIDAPTMTIARIVVSRGLLEDLLKGALQVPIVQIADESGRIKIM